MRVLLTGGGTAGHINPALAIADTVRQNSPGSEIAFVGIENGKEAELVPKEGYPLYFVDSMGIKRSFSLQNLKAISLAINSPFAKKTTRILTEFKPDIVIGTGGYACWPIMAAAARKGIPTAVHESNAIPGLAVRELQSHVDEIWLNFEATRERLRRKKDVYHVGNPLRQAFGTISKEEARRKLGISDDRLVILSFGGSLGAERVNEAVLSLMKEFSSRHPEVLHFHAAGKRNAEDATRAFREAGLENAQNCLLYDYFYDMALRMTAADIVISRAGAMTLSELALMKKASILIPSPNVADNHQFKNAHALSEKDAAILVEEKDLDAGALTDAVLSLVNDPAKKATLESNITGFADADANRRIWERILILTGKKTKQGR